MRQRLPKPPGKQSGALAGICPGGGLTCMALSRLCALCACPRETLMWGTEGPPPAELGVGLVGAFSSLLFPCISRRERRAQRV